ncbi:12990_t:CDS:2 [Funneliformis caledonium]|uniref:12990_t:CDS:1 n=1 Tax=Funneliformis caledonium TaxID=1117310 RepID=A0A9N9B8T4_9GLOM|nr:12990_t:CDS:2 [Funneliformis caledonium]
MVRKTRGKKQLRKNDNDNQDITSLVSTLPNLSDDESHSISENEVSESDDNQELSEDIELT